MSPEEKPPIRPFLKWAGGKFRLLPKIKALLPAGNRLIEPFVGAGAVFLNTHYKHYLLSDCNSDLVNLYRILQKKGDNFIDQAERYFKPANNQAEVFYEQRVRFNEIKRNTAEKAALFLYLNRHGYNGLCRYNSKHEFNVPFGLYRKPYFPAKEMQAFYHKAQSAEFICSDYLPIMNNACEGDIVYCDPPYAPLSDSAHFTRYSGDAFTFLDQQRLAETAEKLAEKNIPVLLSNHDTEAMRKLYHKSEQTHFNVARLISQKTQQRLAVGEILALYSS
ncbi:MAG: Dam family site-specific DNA-(adenine-N6)-methyltransferase [Legionellales bacterium]|nr:Dam family site-specific DNA-(adenine-N6)-methyltransferase [Legionellales bacterium]